MIAQEIKEDENNPQKIIEQLAKNTPNTEASISNVILRCIILPPIMKDLTIELRGIIAETTQQIKNNRDR